MNWMELILAFLSQNKGSGAVSGASNVKSSGAGGQDSAAKSAIAALSGDSNNAANKKSDNSQVPTVVADSAGPAQAALQSLQIGNPFSARPKNFGF